MQYGDIVKIECGVIKDGWVGDTATTVPVGVVDARMQRLMQVTEDALEIAIRHAQAGHRLGDLSAAVEEEVEGGRVVHGE